MALLSRSPWLYEPRKPAGDKREGEWSLFILGEGGYAGVEGGGGASIGRSGKTEPERDKRCAGDGTDPTFSGMRPTCTGVDIN